MGIIFGTRSDDHLRTRGLGDILLGNGGDDTLEALHGFGILFGGEGSDHLFAWSSYNILSGGSGDDDLQAFGNWNLLLGGDGDDWLYSEGDNNTLYGGAGNDVLRVAVGSGSVLNGGVGDDTLFGGASDEVLEGGDGHDTVDYAAATLGLNVDLLAGTATGTEIGTDTLSSIERVIGGQGNDSLAGNANDNVLEGGGGGDTLIGEAGNDVLNGGVIADFQSYVGSTDLDRVDYSAAPGPVNVNLNTGIALDGEGGTDALIGIERVTGSAYADVLTGSDTTFSEAFRGGAGDDMIDGGALFDTAEYYFATAPISVNLASGTVTGDLSVGTDTLTEVEIVIGTAFGDTFVATGFQSPSIPGGVLSTFNSFEGRGGDDSITGNGATRIEYSSALEAVNVNLATGSAVGGTSVGVDTFSGVNSVRGSPFADTLRGSAAGESFDGRGSDDFIEGGSGFDRADYAFVGAVTAGLTVNLAAGAATGDPALVGTDTLRSIESIRGSYLADLFDATGFSSMSLNAGSNGTFNLFEGMAGDDTVIGNGNTRIVYGFAFEGVSVNLATGTAVGGPSAGMDTFSGVNGVGGSNFSDALTGSESNDSLDGQAGNDTLIGLGGNDFLIGGTGDDAMSGGDGTDTLIGSGGSDTLDGGSGTDRADYSGSTGAISADLTAGTANDGMGGADILLSIEQLGGSSFDDTLRGSSGNNLLFGGGGNDTLIGLGGSDSLSGDSGNDTLVGDESDDFLNGGDGDDAVSGGDGNDTLIGLNGNDTLAGGAGFDMLDGGPGTDRADYSGSAAAVSADLAAGGASEGASSDILFGIEDLVGSTFDDTLRGSSVNNNLSGGAGNDTLSGGAGNDVLNGGIVSNLNSYAEYTDVDRADYTAAPGPVDVNLNTGLASDGEAGLDALTGIENVTGSAFDDVLIGSAMAITQSFRGGPGNDTINGLGLFDIADYSFATGPIAANLALGSVTGDPSIGTDSLAEVEILIGTNFNDAFNALGFLSPSAPNGVTSVFNSFEGRGGDDLIVGNGATRIEYASAPYGVTVDLTTGIVFGGAALGTDTFSGVNNVRGSGFVDTLIGGNSANTGLESFDGRAGNDYIDGGAGFDRADYAFVGPVTVALTVNLATGVTTGDPTFVGTDTLRSIESIRGSYLNDLFNATGFGLPGATNIGSNGTFNEFEGMAGDDIITGNGNTRITYIMALDAVNANLTTGIAVGGPSIGTDTFTGVGSVGGSNFNDVMTGSSGNDGLFGGNGDDALSGNDGNDFLDAGNGLDVLTGGNGIDTLRLAGAGTDILDYNAISEAGDTVEQFNAGMGGDVFDVADLLDASTNYADGTGTVLADYVRVVTSGANGLLQIDTDGLDVSASWQTLATILGGSALTLDLLLAGGNIDIFS